MKPADILEWYGRAPRVAPGLRNAVARAQAGRFHGDALLAKLNAAVRRDATSLSNTHPDAQMFEELALCAMSVKIAQGESVGHVITGLVEKIVAGEAANLAELLEPDDEERPLEIVGDVLRELLNEYEFWTAGELCIRHAIDFTEQQWGECLAARVPLMVDLVGDDLLMPETFAGALFAMSTLLAFTSVRPVPTPADKLALMLALREQAPGADEASLLSFLKLLADGREYRQIDDALVARTCHGPLVEAFIRIAPPTESQWLREHLATARAGAPVACASVDEHIPQSGNNPKGEGT